jgi:uncharacterized protein YndB with AHSA1/START domain
MKKWYFEIPEFKAEVGTRFQFSAGESSKKEYMHLCEVLEVEEGKELTYSWRNEGCEGNSTVCFELTDKGDQTILKLTYAVVMCRRGPISASPDSPQKAV